MPAVPHQLHPLVSGGDLFCRKGGFHERNLFGALIVKEDKSTSASREM